MSKVVAVINQKGGVGKTTTTVNLSALVAELGSKKVLLVDLDPQGNSTSGCGIDKKSQENTIYSSIGQGVPIRECTVRTEWPGLDVVPSSIELAGAEVEFVVKNDREYVVKNVLDEVRDSYDFIFIDCPPSLGLLTVNALAAADAVLVPIQCEYYALEGLAQLINTVRIVKKRLNPALEIEGVVLTMLDQRTNLGAQVAAEARTYFKDKVYRTVIPRNVKLGEAPSHGQPIHVYDPKSAGSMAYTELAKEFLKWNET